MYDCVCVCIPLKEAVNAVPPRPTRVPVVGTLTNRGAHHDGSPFSLQVLQHLRRLARHVAAILAVHHLAVNLREQIEQENHGTYFCEMFWISMDWFTGKI